MGSLKIYDPMLLAETFMLHHCHHCSSLCLAGVSGSQCSGAAGQSQHHCEVQHQTSGPQGCSCTGTQHTSQVRSLNLYYCQVLKCLYINSFWMLWLQACVTVARLAPAVICIYISSFSISIASSPPPRFQWWSILSLVLLTSTGSPGGLSS